MAGMRIWIAATVAALGSALMVVAAAEPAEDNSIAGTASVVDGDTIEIHGKRIRLNGFDTPERGSMCGSVNVYQKAALALSDFIGSKTVTCDVLGEDQYERAIGKCRAGNDSLAEHMVANGWGRDWPMYSEGEYADEETAARFARAGIWGLNCPEDLWGDRNYD